MEVKQKLAAEPAIEGIPNRSRIAPFNSSQGSTFYQAAKYRRSGSCSLVVQVTQAVVRYKSKGSQEVSRNC